MRGKARGDESDPLVALVDLFFFFYNIRSFLQNSKIQLNSIAPFYEPYRYIVNTEERLSTIEAVFWFVSAIPSHAEKSVLTEIHAVDEGNVVILGQTSQTTGNSDYASMHYLVFIFIFLCMIRLGNLCRYWVLCLPIRKSEQQDQLNNPPITT